MRDLWRCHYLGSEILQLHDQGEHEQVAALVVQRLKALHQAALDRGAWDNALVLVPGPDPLGRPNFGGDEGELAAIHRYRRSLCELKHNGAKLSPNSTRVTSHDGAGDLDGEDKLDDSRNQSPVKPKPKPKPKK